MDELLLTIKGILDRHFPYMGKSDTRNEASREICEEFEAQLAKAEPIIRKDERERIRTGIAGEISKLKDYMDRVALPEEMTIMLRMFLQILDYALKGEPD